MLRISGVINSFVRPGGNDELSQEVRNDNLDKFSNEKPESVKLSVTAPTISGQKTEKLSFKWSATKPTWSCPFFPQQETRQGGDPYFNLYADGGILEKYDQAFNAKSKINERKYFCKGFNEDRARYGWWEHCDCASAVSCLLQEPKRDVTINGVTFTPHEISGLLCKMIDSLYENDFVGRRGEVMKPEVFLDQVLVEWGKKKNSAFALDVGPFFSHGDDIQNRPYDRGEVYESQIGDMQFYRAELFSTGYEKDNRTYRFFIQRDELGTVLKSGWIDGQTNQRGCVGPKLAWRPSLVGNLALAETWKTDMRGHPLCSVKAEDVKKIYDQSIHK